MTASIRPVYVVDESAEIRAMVSDTLRSLGYEAAAFESPARALDAMLHAALPPVPRGVTRGTHEYFNRVDAARQIAAARKLNRA